MTGIVYGYFDIHTGDCVYIGVDNTSNLARHSNHLKPSKKHLQKINIWLQDRTQGIDWSYVVLYKTNAVEDVNVALNKKMERLLSKKILLAVEALFIENYKPKLNIYLKKEKK